MQKTDVIARLRNFVEENFLYMRPNFELGENDSLMGNGIVDSMGVMEMLEFIDSEFGVTVAETDVTEEKIGTLEAIANYVVARQGQAERQIA